MVELTVEQEGLSENLLFVAFRSAKGRSFAERKATIGLPERVPG
jgi:hypothetical protein